MKIKIEAVDGSLITVDADGGKHILHRDSFMDISPKDPEYQSKVLGRMMGIITGELTLNALQSLKGKEFEVTP